MSRVCVILVNFKSDEKTVRCLHALEGSSLKPDSVVVVDNASSDKSKHNLASREYSLNTQWIWNKQNLGFAAACNQGIAAARAICDADFFWLLNNDTVPETGALEELLNKAIATNAGITGSKITDMQGRYIGGAGKIHKKFASVQRAQETDSEFDYIEGSSFFISRECIDSVGLLSEDYFLYFEESDYCYRAKNKGFSLAWAKDSIVKHDIGTSTGSEKGKGKVPFFIDCIMVRNRIHFAKALNFNMFGIYIGLAISLFLRIKRMQFARVFTIPLLVCSKSRFKKFILKNGGYIK